MNFPPERFLISRKAWVRRIMRKNACLEEKLSTGSAFPSIKCGVPKERQRCDATATMLQARNRKNAPKGPGGRTSVASTRRGGEAAKAAPSRHRRDPCSSTQILTVSKTHFWKTRQNVLFGRQESMVGRLSYTLKKLEVKIALRVQNHS